MIRMKSCCSCSGFTLTRLSPLIIDKVCQWETGKKTETSACQVSYVDNMAPLRRSYAMGVAQLYAAWLCPASKGPSEGTIWLPTANVKVTGAVTWLTANQWILLWMTGIFFPTENPCSCSCSIDKSAILLQPYQAQATMWATDDHQFMIKGSHFSWSRRTNPIHSTPLICWHGSFSRGEASGSLQGLAEYTSLDP